MFKSKRKRIERLEADRDRTIKEIFQLKKEISELRKGSDIRNITRQLNEQVKKKAYNRSAW